MPHDVIMPALGMNQTTGKILAWLKGKGDPVKIGDPVMEVETDKAVVEVEAQAAGVLIEIRHAAGSEVPVGHVVAVIGTGALCWPRPTMRPPPAFRDAPSKRRLRKSSPPRLINDPPPLSHRRPKKD